ncbi:DsbA family oxidoreductase [Variovorax sp. GT1P44]|uniref:DsbA family oxidoreductase n=1 Tax=Variovorax sp. GT1P44 TaxID=3443742 RepID=UPI003F461936
MKMPASMAVPKSAEGVGARRSLAIEVFFDFVCPWCLIGKRHADAAARKLAELRQDVHLEVFWRSHVLLPDTPEGGVPYQAFYLARLGSSEAVTMRRAQVQQAGNAAGVQFAFDRIQVLPNTARAHALIERTDKTQQAKLVDRIFTAYFLEGKDIGDCSVLERLALECGLQPDVSGSLGGDESCAGGRSPVATCYPVQGVPFFVLDGSLAFSGAMPSETMLDAILQALDA